MKRLLLIPVLAAALSLPAGAQCVMCYRTSHAQNQARARVLNMGILLLGAPPFLILAGFITFVFKRDRLYREEEQATQAVGLASCGGNDQTVQPARSWNS